MTATKSVARRLARSLTALGALAALACCAEDAPDADLPEFYDLVRAPEAIRKAARAVVRIQHPVGAAGTGSFISGDGLLLTNDHVLGGEECAREGCNFTLSFDHQRGMPVSEPREVYGVPEHVDVGLDMAVLQVYEDASQREHLATPDFLTLEMRDAKALIGSRVSVVGHPLGRLKKWSTGEVINAQGEWFESTAFSLPGSSGSPLLDDQGRVVGLLHRGADGFDLLTRTSSNVSTIATAAAALKGALRARLPATVISLEDTLSEAQILARTDVFLAAERAEANLDGSPTPILTILAKACDAGIEREDYTSLEDLMSGLEPCYVALDFIECRTDLAPSPPDYTSCPGEQREAWIERMGSVFARQLEFNGALELSPISFGIESLALSEGEGRDSARAAILRALDEAAPVYDFALAPYLAAYGISSYAGQGTVDLIQDYRRFPYYERSAWEIVLSALWLYSEGAIEREAVVRSAKQLYRDGRVSLGAKLRIEEVLYNSGEL